MLLLLTSDISFHYLPEQMNSIMIDHHDRIHYDDQNLTNKVAKFLNGLFWVDVAF